MFTSVCDYLTILSLPQPSIPVIKAPLLLLFPLRSQEFPEKGNYFPPPSNRHNQGWGRPPPSNITADTPTVKLFIFTIFSSSFARFKNVYRAAKGGGGDMGLFGKGLGIGVRGCIMGSPSPPPHTPALRNPLTGLRAQVDSIWKAWLFQELLDQAGEWARKELRFHGWKAGKGQGTQDQGFWIWTSVEDSTPPLYKFGTNIPRKATQYMRIRSHLHRCPLKPFLTSFLSPEVQIQRALGSCFPHCLSKPSCWCLPKPCPPRPPPSAPRCS